MEIKTQKYYRDFTVNRGRGTEYMRWWAWRAPRPAIKGYGRIKEEAIYDLVHFVQPLNTDNSTVVVADNA